MPQTCLIAAHDPWFIQLLRIYSEESGFRVLQVYEGQDVLPMVLSEKPAAVLLQIDLPGQIKGRDVLHLLKRDPATCRVPVLAFSWQAQDEVEDLEEIVAAHLQEPVTYEAFSEALERAGVDCHRRTRPVESKNNADKSNSSNANQKSNRVKSRRKL